jgi:V/A-type H+/Na+-transporting ATPase subunit C
MLFWEITFLWQTTRYADVLAKIGAERSSLLSEEKLKAFAENKTLMEFASQLRTTSYQEKITKIPLPLSSRKLERVFQETLINAYSKIVKSAPKKVKPFLEMYLSRFEVENIKVLIKAVFAELNFDEKLTKVFLPVEGFLKNRLFFEEAARAVDLKQLVNAFKNTEYASALNLGFKRFEENGSTIFFDVQLDKEFFEKLYETFQGLPKKEKPHAFFYASMETGGFTILMLLRGKALNYDAQWLRVATPKCTLNLPRETIDALIMATDYPSALSLVLKSHYKKFFVKAESPEETIANAQKVFRSAFFDHALEYRVTEAFNVGAALSFMVQKEVEVRNLVTISIGVEAGMKPEDIKRLMLLAH